MSRVSTAPAASSLHSGFRPDPAQAEAIRDGMKEGLADSLRYLHRQSADLVPVDPQRLQALLQRIGRSASIHPDLFALYQALVEAMLSDDIPASTALFEELLAHPVATAPLQVLPLDAAALGSDTADRYVRLVDLDPELRLGLTAPDPADAQRVTAHLRRALELLRQAAPDLYGELQYIATQFVLAAGSNPEVEFHGASSLFVWGAVFLNAAHHRTLPQALDALAHESAHGLLFALSKDEPLVRNPDEERFDSPLRQDARPMDGIYHATFVLARMHLALDLVLQAGLLEGADREEAEQMRADRVRLFNDGLETLRREGRLTPLGARLMAAAEAYMASVTGDTAL